MLHRIQELFRNGRPTNERRIFLDYAAATPVAPHVAAAMEPYQSRLWANPSSIHKEGVLVREAIESARTELARTLHIRESGIVFTASGTEANNLALFGLVESLKKKGKDYREMEIISTKVEHPSVSETLKVLEGFGVTITYIPVDSDGRIDGRELGEALSAETVLVTFAYVNSETGVIQDIKHLSRIIKKYATASDTEILFHTDASQAPLWLPCGLDVLGVDMLTLDGGKCYGPKGVGVLASIHGVELVSQIHGGAQEHGLRAGTESAALIVGCVAALTHAQRHYKEVADRVTRLRDHLIERLSSISTDPPVVLNGSRTHRVANNVNVSIPGINSEFCVITLDARGIAASTKSACGSGKGGGSAVVSEMTHDEARASSTIRFTLGLETTIDDITRAADIFNEHITKMRAFSSRYHREN